MVKRGVLLEVSHGFVSCNLLEGVGPLGFVANHAAIVQEALGGAKDLGAH